MPQVPHLLRGGIPDGAFTEIEGDAKEVVADLRNRNREERESERTAGAEIAPKLMPLTLTIDLASNGSRQSGQRCTWRTDAGP